MKPLLLILLFAAFPAFARPDAAVFRSIPQESRPWCYWMWVNGNVDRAAITADLENMRDVGFGGVLLFDLRGYERRLKLPPVDAEVMSERWFDFVEFAIRECARLGLEFSINASSCGGSLKGFREGREYEVDVTDSAAVEAHLESFVGPIIARVPELVGKTFTHIYSVSWEGHIRRTDADSPAELSRRICKSFYGTMRTWAHRHGLGLYSESGGPWQLAPEFCAGADQQEFLAANDLPQGEFWVTEGHPAEGGAEPFHLRGVALAAKRRGLRRVAAEAFTHMWKPYSMYPARLKGSANNAFADGVNLLVWHTYTCSPDRFGEPGLEYFAGTHVNRHVTWQADVRPFIDYLSRCQYLLQQGELVLREPPEEKRRYLHFGHFDELFADPSDCALPSGWRFVHRRLDDADIYFICGEGRGRVSFGVTGRRAELWDPMDGCVRTADRRESGGRTEVDLDLPRDGALFVVLTPERPLKWTVDFGGRTIETESLFDWASREDTKYYSGTAVYRTTFDGRSSEVLLGEVRGGTARVLVNGVDCGVAWCEPWRVRIPDGVTAATGNRLEVRVTNTWRNRLIGDCFLPPDKRVTKSCLGYFNGDRPAAEFGDECRGCSTTDKLEPSGLIGPVTLEEKQP